MDSDCPFDIFKLFSYLHVASLNFFSCTFSIKIPRYYAMTGCEFIAIHSLYNDTTYLLWFFLCMSLSCVLCSSCCQFLWIIHCVFCFVCLRPVSRVPRVASFSGLSIVFFVLYVYVLCLVFLVLPVSLDYPLCFLFCMSSSCVSCSSCCQFLWIIHS